tara:strand:- start:44 stop:1363 length:1320 start_codon:yes stop_codon:yes gene_type:complete
MKKKYTKRNRKNTNRKYTKRKKYKKRKTKKILRGGYYDLYKCGHPEKEEIVLNQERNEGENLYNYLREDEEFTVAKLKEWLREEELGIPEEANIDIYKTHRCDKTPISLMPDEKILYADSEEKSGDLYVYYEGMNPREETLEGDETVEGDETTQVEEGGVGNLASVPLSDKSTGSFLRTIDGRLVDDDYINNELKIISGLNDINRFKFLMAIMPGYLKVGYTIPTALLALYNSGLTERELEVLYKLLIRINSNIDFNDIDQNDYSPLSFAIIEIDNINIIKYLIEVIGVDVNKENRYGNSPLYIACLLNKSEAVDILIDNGADINKRNQTGYNPLKIAFMRDNSYIVQSLKKAGAFLKELHFIIGIPKYQVTVDLGIIPIWEDMNVVDLIDIIKKEAYKKDLKIPTVPRLIWAGRELVDSELLKDMDFDDDEEILLILR